MYCIKIVLTLYLLLLSCKFIPSRKLVMNNDLYNVFILVLLCIIALNDVYISLLLCACIILNTKNEYIETLFQEYSPNQISELLKTIHYDGSDNNEVINESKSSVTNTDDTKAKNKQIDEVVDASIQTSVVKKANKTKPKNNHINNCSNQMFIISEEMLQNAQTNDLNDNTYINMFPNQHINIQGMNNSMTGFNI